jgi:FMN phosphatase YigB (HAD superfamily)
MMAGLHLPKGLLLDFGGVIVDSTKPPRWQERVTDEMIRLVGMEGLPDRARVLADVTAGALAAGLWRNAMSRPMHPRELGQREYVMDFIAADWPVPARAAIEPHIAEICYLVSSTKESRQLRPGIQELLEWSGSVGIPVAIVSNAMCGKVHRDYLDQIGLSSFFVAELYSDEVGLRKPNPDFMLQGSAALGLGIGDCWYVGDHLDRDVLCGIRAGTGANVLMPSPGSSAKPFEVPVTADMTVGSPQDLLDVLRRMYDDR